MLATTGAGRSPYDRPEISFKARAPARPRTEALLLALLGVLAFALPAAPASAAQPLVTAIADPAEFAGPNAQLAFDRSACSSFTDGAHIHQLDGGRSARLPRSQADSMPATPLIRTTPGTAPTSRFALRWPGA